MGTVISQRIAAANAFLTRYGGARRAVNAVESNAAVAWDDFLQSGYSLMVRVGCLPPAQRSMAFLWSAQAAGDHIPHGEYAALTYSPFSWHASIFTAVLCDPSLPFGNPAVPLDIACYGAGFHDYAANARAMIPKDSSPKDAAEDRLDADLITQIQQAVFGPLGGTSNEPRDLLTLFLSGKRPGSLTVFDRDPTIGTDLQRPWYLRFNNLDLLGRANNHWKSFADHYWQVLTAGRQTRRDVLGTKSETDVVRFGFRFTDEEWNKLLFTSIDMMTDSIPARSESFDWSIWLEGEYFMPGGSMVHLGDIVDRTKIGGYLCLSHYHPPELLSALGVQPLGIFGNDTVWNSATILLQRVERTRTVEQLVVRKKMLAQQFGNLRAKS